MGRDWETRKDFRERPHGRSDLRADDMGRQEWFAAEVGRRGGWEVQDGRGRLMMDRDRSFSNEFGRGQARARHGQIGRFGGRALPGPNGRGGHMAGRGGSQERDIKKV
jgi:hypothetical protein